MPYSNYQQFITELKDEIQVARIKAVLSVNAQLLQLYWQIGNSIISRQSIEGWGTKVIKRISADLKDAFPDMKGISERNLKYMRAFAEAYPSFVQDPLAQIQGENNDQKVQAILAQISWYHHITLLDKVKEEKIRIFYVEKTIANGWSRDVMVNQIESKLHLRQGRLQNNFHVTLPAITSDLTNELFKDPYKLDFLSLSEEINERQLEDALLSHISKFLLEMGKGFAFLERQAHLSINGKDYYIDLLFYHTKLHCHVILELKIGEFIPEYAGKMNFYLNAFDSANKVDGDGPSIGIILCKNKDKVTVEYALKDLNKPIGVAQYDLTRAIPEDLKAELPSIKDLEEELEKEIEIPQRPIDEKITKLQNMVEQLNNEEIKIELTPSITYALFTETLFDIRKKALRILDPVLNLFRNAMISYSIDGVASFLGATDLKAEFLHTTNVHEIGLRITLEGFKKGGVKSFNWFGDMKFFLGKFKYQVGPEQNNIWQEYLYHKIWTDEDIEQLAEKWAERIVEGVQYQIENIK